MQQFLVQLPAARRLRADEDVAEADARKEDRAVVNHHAPGRLAPAAHAFDAGRHDRRGELVGACERGVRLVRASSLVRRGTVGGRRRRGFGRRSRRRLGLECRDVARLELREKIEGAFACRMIGALERVFEVVHDAFEQRARDVVRVERHRPAHLRAQVAERSRHHLVAQPVGQGIEPLGVGVRIDVRHGRRHGIECRAILRQVHAARLQLIEQSLLGIGQRPRLVALVAQALEDAEQGRRHVQVVGADVVAARRVVVVDDGDAPFVLGRVLQGQPAFDAPSQQSHLSLYRGGQGQRETGARVDRRGRHRRDHQRLRDPLQLRHRDAVVDAVLRQAFLGQLPLGTGDLGETYALQHRHVERGELGIDPLAAFARADHEVLQRDDRAEGARVSREQPHRRHARLAPVGKQAQAAVTARLDALAQRPVQVRLAGPVTGLVIEDGDPAASVVELQRVGCQLAPADEGAQGGLQDRCRHLERLARQRRQVSHQGVRVRGAAARPEQLRDQPSRVFRMGG